MRTAYHDQSSTGSTIWNGTASRKNIYDPRNAHDMRCRKMCQVQYRASIYLHRRTRIFHGRAVCHARWVLNIVRWVLNIHPMSIAHYNSAFMSLLYPIHAKSTDGKHINPSVFIVNKLWTNFHLFLCAIARRIFYRKAKSTYFFTIYIFFTTYPLYAIIMENNNFWYTLLIFHQLLVYMPPSHSQIHQNS